MVVHHDDASALRELNAALERFRGEPRGALGVTATADAATARRAFMALAKVYHPARFARFAPATVKLSNEVYLAIRRAYETVIAAAPVPRHVPTHERVTTRMPRMSGTPASGVPIGRSAAEGNETARIGSLGRSAAEGNDTARIGSLGRSAAEGNETARVGRASPAPTMPQSVPRPQPATPPSPPDMPRDEQDRFERALQHARAQRWPEARAAFSELITQYPGAPRYRAYLHYARGWEAFGLGKDGEAKAEWNRALACDPTNGLVRWALETTGLAAR